MPRSLRVRSDRENQRGTVKTASAFLTWIPGTRSQIREFLLYDSVAQHRPACRSRSGELHAGTASVLCPDTDVEPSRINCASASPERAPPLGERSAPLATRSSLLGGYRVYSSRH